MKFTTIPALILTLALVACGNSELVGSYTIVSDGPGKKGTVLTLKPGGKAVYLGNIELDYEVDGKEVRILRPDGNLILTLLGDGSLSFPGLGKLKKVEK